MRIHSPNNEHVKRLARLLKSAADRREENVLVLDSPKLIRELFARSPEAIQSVFLREGVEMPDFQNPVILDAVLFDRISDLPSPQGIMAIATRPHVQPLQLQAAKRIVILDAVQDPANLGAILRSAWAFGWDAVVLGAGTADPFSPKTVRASAGTALQIPIFDMENALPHLLALPITTFFLDANAKTDIRAVEKPDRLAIVLGSEGQGISKALSEKMQGVPIAIPIKKDVESLNVGVAAGLAFFMLNWDR